MSIRQAYYTPVLEEGFGEEARLTRIILEWYIAYIEKYCETPTIASFMEFYSEYWRELYKETLVDMDIEDLELLAEREYHTYDIEEMSYLELENERSANFEFYSTPITVACVGLNLAFTFTPAEIGFVDESDFAIATGDDDEYEIGAQLPVFRVAHYSGRAYSSIQGAYKYLEEGGGLRP